MAGKKVPINTDMVEMYLSGKSSKECAQHFGYKHGITCLNHVRAAGYDVRSPWCNPHRHYTLNQDFFEVIDTEEKAYWLGMLSADGTIENNRVCLGLNSGDKEHLEKLLKSVESNAPIYQVLTVLPGRKNEYSRSYIRLGSKKMVSDLAKLGVLPQKTFTIKPAKLREDLQRHYWRGMLDGDGYIGLGRKTPTRVSLTVGLVGNYDMVDGFRLWCASQLGEDVPKIVKHGNIYRFSFRGHRRCSIILRRLYDDSSVWLTRKREQSYLVTHINRGKASGVKRSDQDLLALARELAAGSNCSSRQVGAVLTIGDYVIAYGCNNPPRGSNYCQNRNETCRRRVLGYGSGEGLHECPAVHAETNCIVQAARNGVCTKDTTLYAYCGRPCKQCIGVIINAGVTCLVYLADEPDYDELSGVLLAESGISVRTVNENELDD